MKKLSEIEGVSIRFQSSHFKEFVVDFSGTGKSYPEINKALLAYNIFGGKNLTEDFSGLKDCALFCVSEILEKEDVDAMISAIKKVVA
jgi:glycine dehydrogenase subunit 1